jgi:hypothetical protein
LPADDVGVIALGEAPHRLEVLGEDRNPGRDGGRLCRLMVGVGVLEHMSRTSIEIEDELIAPGDAKVRASHQARRRSS